MSNVLSVAGAWWMAVGVGDAVVPPMSYCCKNMFEQSDAGDNCCISSEASYGSPTVTSMILC